tara:strand:- start:20013 stop:20261 length:249 start_codon:yes stop_codon:yes gene_type:complete
MKNIKTWEKFNEGRQGDNNEFELAILKQFGLTKNSSIINYVLHAEDKDVEKTQIHSKINGKEGDYTTLVQVNDDGSVYYMVK